MAQAAVAVGAATRPARRPATQPARRASEQPALRVAAREQRARVVTFVVLATIFTLVTAVVFHVVLAQGQLQLDRLDRVMDSARREYEERRLQVSTLASPQRIVERAEALGLEMPDQPPSYIVLPGAPPPAATGGETATTLDDWKKVKQHLGDGP
jgi:cell division protein FtsL